MFMNIGKWKGIRITFFCVETDRYSLYGADIVHRALLVKIRQRDMSGLFVDIDRRDRCGNLLNQRKTVLLINLIGTVDKLFQR